MNAPSTTRQRPSSESSSDGSTSRNNLPLTNDIEIDPINAELSNAQTLSSPLVSASPPDPFTHARALIRLLQCRQCSKPLRQPVALPCGESLCKACLPQTFERANISYPAAPDRLLRFSCPFNSCERKEHALVDCGVDVTLSRILEGGEAIIASVPKEETTAILLEEVLPNNRGLLDGMQSYSQVLCGGRLAATYQMASMGLLRYDSEVRYTTMSANDEDDNHKELDISLLAQCLELIRPEMECQVCYSLLLDPVTTSCGHTFCRACLERVLDHAMLCPLCRRDLPPISHLSSQPSNAQIKNIINSLCPEILQQRGAIEEVLVDDESEPMIPIFVCALTFPTIPMFLHIFEPRYRLMIRRALESPSRSFGIVDYNRGGAPQGVNGEFIAPFKQFGTLLYITGYQMLPDGRSLIETVGTTRFKVSCYREEDGYTVGSVERIDDISTADEEAMESLERMFHTFPQGSIPEWARLPTVDLLQIGLDFVATMRRSSAGWFHDRVLRTYGQPPSDPATFPYWLATLLPVDDEEKYQLLMAGSVRERLKMVVGWIKAIEQRQWFPQAILNASCTIS